MNDKKCKVCIVEAYEARNFKIELDMCQEVAGTPLPTIFSSVANATAGIVHEEEQHGVFWLEAADRGQGLEEVGIVDDRSDGTLLSREDAERLAEDSAIEEEWDDDASASDFYYGYISWRGCYTRRAFVVEEG